MKTTGEEFRNALQRVRSAASKKPDQHPVLHAVLIEHDGNKGRMVAADNYRVRVIPFEAESLAPVSFLLPMWSVPLVLEFLKVHPGDVTVTVDGEMASFEAAGVGLTVRTMHGTYPDIAKVIDEVSPVGVIGINPDFLKDLSQLGPILTVRLTGPLAPIVFEAEGGTEYLMPARIAESTWPRDAAKREAA